MKQLRFYVKDKINLKVNSGNKNHYGTIVAIGDSNIIVVTKKTSDTIALSKIRMIVLNHSNYLTESFFKVCMIAGFGIIGIDALNNIFNNESQIIKPRIVKTGIGFVSAGIVLKFLGKKRYKIGKKKILRVIELKPF